MAEAMRVPDVEAQRAAMRRLGFLVGDWAGEASMLRGPGLYVEMAQTERARYRLDGLLLEIEGVGRAVDSKIEDDGRVVLEALGVISYDDGAEKYWMRAFNDGRWLETEVKLADGEESISWGFVLGEYRTETVLRINEKGEWTEDGKLMVGERVVKMMELRVGRI